MSGLDQTVQEVKNENAFERSASYSFALLVYCCSHVASSEYNHTNGVNWLSRCLVI